MMHAAEIQFRNGLIEGERRQKAKDAAELDALARMYKLEVERNTALRAALAQSVAERIVALQDWHEATDALERAEAQRDALRALLNAIPDPILQDTFYGTKKWASNIRALREGGK
jgi:PAS domain-containing protein